MLRACSLPAAVAAAPTTSPRRRSRRPRLRPRQQRLRRLPDRLRPVQRLRGERVRRRHRWPRTSSAATSPTSRRRRARPGTSSPAATRTSTSTPTAAPTSSEKLAGEGGPVVRLGTDRLPRWRRPARAGVHGRSRARHLPGPPRHRAESAGAGSRPRSRRCRPCFALAQSFVEFQHLDYVVRDYSQVGVGNGMGDLLQQAREDDERQRPNLYLVEGPRPFLGDGPGPRHGRDPGVVGVRTACPTRSRRCARSRTSATRRSSTATSPRRAARRTTWSTATRSDSEEVDNLLEIVELSGYDVSSADVASWINTHQNVWRHWLD